MRIESFRKIHRQSGQALLLCLLVQLPLLLLASSTIDSALIGERVAANFEDTHVALRAAEQAQSAAQQWIDGQRWVPDCAPEDHSESAHQSPTRPPASLEERRYTVRELFRVEREEEAAPGDDRPGTTLVVGFGVWALGTGRRSTSRAVLRSTEVRSYSYGEC